MLNFRNKLPKSESLWFILIVLFLFTGIWLTNEHGKKIVNWPLDKFKYLLNENQIDCCDNTSTVLDEFFPHNRSIMYIEGYFNAFLTPRMLCAIESAALTHPNTTVNVLMTSHKYRKSALTKSVTDVYKNIKFQYINSTELYLNSPLKNWFLNQTWKKSNWPDINFSDPLRFLLLYKYGGVYLDLDVIVMRNLMTEENFVGLQSDDVANTAVMGFAANHTFIKECIQEMTQHFDLHLWGTYGPDLLTRMIKKKCGKSFPLVKLQECSHIKIYKQKAFYPIHWSTWKQYFQVNKNLSNSILFDSDVLAAHVWNFLSHNQPLIFRESSPFAVIANKFCPVVVYESGDKF